VYSVDVSINVFTLVGKPMNINFDQGPKLMFVVGLMLVLGAVVWQLLGPYLNFGKLPGDIAVEKENFKFYFPITTSILISVVLSLIFWLFNKTKT
jgi:hypothetical protein